LLGDQTYTFCKYHTTACAQTVSSVGLPITLNKDGM